MKPGGSRSRAALSRGEGTLCGQVALVTGGTRGLGKEFVRALAAAGASLAVLSRNQADCDSVVIELAENGTAAVGVEADVTDRAQLVVCLEPIEEALGPVGILVNNAGIALKKDALDVSVEEWSQVLSVNLDGVWNCSQILGRGIVARGHGSIINIGSMSGLIVNRPNSQPAYNASKAAVHHLTRSLGRRVDPARGPGERSRAWLREHRHVARRRPGAPSMVDRGRTQASLRGGRGVRTRRADLGRQGLLLRDRQCSGHGRRPHAVLIRAVRSVTPDQGAEP
jgi:NADP-dependent 3-hydroxy acid dehydrogenase YdfG